LGSAIVTRFTSNGTLTARGSMNRPVLFAIAGLVGICASRAPAAELPKHYFDLLSAEVKALSAEDLKSNPGAMFAAAVLYSQKHAENPAAGDEKLLKLSLVLGDLLAAQSEADQKQDKQDYEWEIHFWLDTYRLLEPRLGDERKARWRREMEKIATWFAGQVAYRLDFPRYQGPYIRTSTNHLALFASTVYLTGRVLGNKAWEQLGAQAMHRLAAEEQATDGYWGEFTDRGPATGYNYITMCCVALYYEHSRDPAAHEALRRATDFHKHFTWPDGTPVETINGRNRRWEVSAWGQFGFTHWPDGRRYAEFLANQFVAGKISSRNLGRLAQSALYYDAGPTEAIPQQQPRSAYQMKAAQAGIRKTGPWTVCMSGLIDVPIDSQFTLDRQGHISIYHEKLGLIVTGANSKQQPELATFSDRTADKLTTIPLSSRLRMTDERDRLGLAYNTFFAEAEIPAPSDNRLGLTFAIVETGGGRLKDAALHLQLCLKEGEALETAKSQVVLDDKPVELTAEQVGGVIRHHGWTLKVDSAARLTWPVLPFNPYANAPEKELRYAVGVLTVPVQVQSPQTYAALNWRRGSIGLELEVASTTK